VCLDALLVNNVTVVFVDEATGVDLPLLDPQHFHAFVHCIGFYETPRPEVGEQTQVLSHGREVDFFLEIHDIR
jgi:hypothetical protein